MLKRTISGAFFVAIIVGFLLLRQFVDYRLFEILIWFFCAVGTYEVARAVNDFTFKGTKIIATIFGVVFLPHFFVINNFVLAGKGWIFSLGLIALMLLILGAITIIKRGKLSQFLYSSLPFIYPSCLLLCLTLANEFAFMVGFVAVVLVFVISSLSDTFAYLVGMAYSKIKKGNAKKLCPKLSPKKTWSGAIGGTIGGVVSSIVLYFIFKPTVNFFSPILLFILIGLIASILNIFGDLFESFIKRKVGIKDMGKIMPGHGGVLDRIDGTMFVIVFVYLAFIFV